MTFPSDHFRLFLAPAFISLILTSAATRPGVAQEPGAPPVTVSDSMLSDSAKVKAKGATTARPKPPAPVWPVPGPAPLPGSILPAKRIVAYYGNPLSKRMGILGQVPPDEMLSRLDKEVAAWNAADPATPVQPALHLIAVVAQAGPGRDGMYRARMSDSLIERVASWAARRNAIVFLDIQVGKSNVKAELPRLIPFLKRPNIHLGLDPEFSMKGGHKPGTRIGTMDASDINYTIGLLSQLVREHSLPPKVLVVHRFTRPMLTGTRRIELDPRVQVVIEMDGFGPPRLKRDSYQSYVYAEPVQFTGFKIFYKNDKPRMTPEEVLKLTPAPVYIQYQ